MFRLRKTEPPYGTEDAPLWEHSYVEQVKVVNGICEVQDSTTRDYLLKMGYEEIKEEPVAVAGSEDQKPKPSAKQKFKGKAKR